jgi:hypothetical protein
MKDEQFDYLTFLIMIVLRYNVKTLNIISNAHILNTLVADICKEPTLYKPAILGWVFSTVNLLLARRRKTLSAFDIFNIINYGSFPGLRKQSTELSDKSIEYICMVWTVEHTYQSPRTEPPQWTAVGRGCMAAALLEALSPHWHFPGLRKQSTELFDK